MSNLATFATGSKGASAVVTAATTALDAPTAANLKLIWTAGASGSLISKLQAAPRDTIADAQMQVYSSTDSGTTFVLVDTAKLSAWTLATGTAASKADFGYTPDVPLRLAAAERLYVGSAVALVKGIAFRAEGGDL